MLAAVGNTQVALGQEVRPRARTPVLDTMPDMPTDATGAPISNLTVFMIPHSHD
eukprot:COSAG02_NODE_20154_length_846_cov_1.054886_1_plen_53_part_01